MACFVSFDRGYRPAVENSMAQMVELPVERKWFMIDFAIETVWKSIFHTSFTSGVVLRLSSSSRASCILRIETVRRRSVFGFAIGTGFTPPLLFALVLLLLWCLPIVPKEKPKFKWNCWLKVENNLTKASKRHLPVSWVESPEASTDWGVGGADCEMKNSKFPVKLSLWR